MMLAGKWPISPEEKQRRNSVRAALQPGVELEFINSDYHEDDETPHGFMVQGDVVKLIRVVEQKWTVDSATRKPVSPYNEWEVETHWGLCVKSEFYLGAMTKVKV